MLRLSTFVKEKEKRRGGGWRKGKKKKTLGVKRIEKECRIASPFRARPPLLQREVITEFMKGKIYGEKITKPEEIRTRQGKEKTWLFFLSLFSSYLATFPIINPRNIASRVISKINRIIQPILTNISTLSFGQLLREPLLFRREREERTTKLRKKFEATSRKQVASRYFRQPSVRNSSDELRTTIPLARLSLRRGSSHSAETKG